MKIVLTAGAVAAYALASAWLMLHATNAPWAVLAIFGPVLLGIGGVALKKRHWPSLLAALLLAAGLLLVTQRGSVGDVQRLYLLQHMGLHLMLALGFGLTLRSGATPLISAMAARLHHDFTPAMQAYTRRLTALWVAYFIGMAGLSWAIYATAPWSWWLVFANVLTPLFALAFFLGEIPLRYWLHPEFERSSLAQMLDAWQQRRAEGGL